MHESLIFFFLDGEDIQRLPDSQFADLVQSRMALLPLASKTIRVADWYVELEHGFPVKLVNETYSILVIDQEGWVDWDVTLGRVPESPNLTKIPKGDAPTSSESSLTVKTPAGAWLPNADEREALNRLAFGPDASTQ